MLADCLDSVKAFTSHNLMCLHGLLQIYLYFHICKLCSYLTENTPVGLHDLLRG
jgi:hypothetical protein